MQNLQFEINLKKKEGDLFIFLIVFILIKKRESRARASSFFLVCLMMSFIEHLFFDEIKYK